MSLTAFGSSSHNVLHTTAALPCGYDYQPESAYHLHDSRTLQEDLEQGEFLDDSEYGFVYLIRNQELVKIGITGNLLRRMAQLEPDAILNVVRCKNYQDLEKDLHRLFKDERIPQTEYFRLSEEQISKVHKLMTSLADF